MIAAFKSFKHGMFKILCLNFQDAFEKVWFDFGGEWKLSQMNKGGKKYYSHLSRITFETFLKGYGQSRMQPAPRFFIQAKFDTSSGSWKGENNWWCEVIYHC